MMVRRRQADRLPKPQADETCVWKWSDARGWVSSDPAIIKLADLEQWLPHISEQEVISKTLPKSKMTIDGIVKLAPGELLGKQKSNQAQGFFRPYFTRRNL